MKHNNLINILLILISIIIIIIYLYVDNYLENYKNNNNRNLNRNSNRNSNKIPNKISNKYELGEIIYKGNKTSVYEINKIKDISKINKKIINKDINSIDTTKKFLYKKAHTILQTPIKDQVNINNNFKYSPKIIDHGDDYYVIERYDSSLKKLILDSKFDKKMLIKLLNILRSYNEYKYNIYDLHLGNIVWSDQKGEFGIIDWDLAYDNDYIIDSKLDDINFLMEIIYNKCKTIKSHQKDKYFNLFKNIYNQQISSKELINTIKILEKTKNLKPKT